MGDQLRVPSPHIQRPARRQRCQGPGDEQVGPAIEAQIIKVDSRQR